MGWYLVEVRDLDGDQEGYAIFDSVTGGIVRPLEGHPQSVFDEVLLSQAEFEQLW